MAEKIVITSGKGGVGKTTVTASLGLRLAEKGHRVLVIDGDLGLNNLDVIVGVESNLSFDLFDALSGKCRVKQALIESPLNKNLFVLPSYHTLSSAEISSADFKRAIESVEGLFDYLLIDSPAGIDVGFHRAVNVADKAIIIVTPTITSVRDADKVISILKSYKLKKIHLIVNRLRGDLVLSGESLSEDDIENTLKIELIGVIPEDDLLSVGKALEKFSESSKAIKGIALAITGKQIRLYDYQKKYTGFWGSIRKELKKRL